MTFNEPEANTFQEYRCTPRLIKAIQLNGKTVNQVFEYLLTKNASIRLIDLDIYLETPSGLLKIVSFSEWIVVDKIFETYYVVQDEIFKNDCVLCKNSK